MDRMGRVYLSRKQKLQRHFSVIKMASSVVTCDLFCPMPLSISSDPFHPKGENIHVAKYLAQCLKSAGLPVDPVRSIEAIQSGILRKKYDLSRRSNKIVLHPGSGSLKKNHSPEFWSNLLKRLCSETDFGRFQPVFLLGPAEKSLHSYFKDSLQPNDIQISFCPGKERLIKTLNEAAIYLGHDSGITHLSAMLGTPHGCALQKKQCRTMVSFRA